MTARPCLWCDGPFTPRTTGGKRQRFCSGGCRKDFHRACRIWAEAQVSSGELPVSELKHTLSQRIRCSEPPSRSNPTTTPDRAAHRSGALPVSACHTAP